MMTLEQVKAMEREGRWAELRSLIPSVLPTSTGAELARLHLSLSTAYFRTAAGAEDLRASLSHARTGFSLTPAGSLMQVGAMQRLSSLLVALGRPLEARRFALAYLKVSANYPDLAAITPYVVRDLSHVAYQQRRFMVAADLRQKAVSLFRSTGNHDEALRTQLNLAWAYARAGRPALGWSCLPGSVPDDMAHLLHGARAALFAAEGRWPEAKVQAQIALDGAARLACDFADAAEVCFILSEAVRRLETWEGAFALILKAAEFAARQGWDASNILLLNQRAGGGEFLHALAADSLGAGGLHIGCRYVSGIA